LPLASTLVRTANDVRTIIVVGDAAVAGARTLARAGVRVIESVALEDALVTLRGLEIRSILIEGGAELAGSFLAAGLVDRLIIFQAPIVLGAGARSAFAHVPPYALPDAPRWRVVSRRMIGKDSMTVYAPGAD